MSSRKANYGVVMAALAMAATGLMACGGMESGDTQSFSVSLGQRSLMVLAHGDWASDQVVYELSYQDGALSRNVRVDGSEQGVKEANAFASELDPAFRAEALMRAGESIDRTNDSDARFKLRLLRVLSGKLVPSTAEATSSTSAALASRGTGVVTNSCYDHYLMCKTYDKLITCIDKYITCKETGNWPSYMFIGSTWSF